MSAEPLRWARCPEDGHLLHLLGPAEVAVATTKGHARALCGIRLAAEGLTITDGSAALCLACLAGVDPAARCPRWAVAPDDDAAHLLLPDNEVPTAARCGHPPPKQARCGVVMPAALPVHNQPLGRTCIQCDLYSLADEHAPGRFARRDE